MIQKKRSRPVLAEHLLQCRRNFAPHRGDHPLRDQVSLRFGPAGAGGGPLGAFGCAAGAGWPAGFGPAGVGGGPEAAADGAFAPAATPALGPAGLGG